MMTRRLWTALVLCLFALTGLSCGGEESNVPRISGVIATVASLPAARETAAASSTRRADYYLQVGQLELQLGAYQAAISAFEAAVELSPNDEQAKKALEKARQAAAEATPLPRPAPTLAPPPFVAGPLELPSFLPSPAPSPTPAPTLTGTPTPAALGCLGDEKMAFSPSSVAVGDRVVISITSGRNQLQVRLAAPGATEFLGVTPAGPGYVWQWQTTASAKGAFDYFFYVDYNTLCAFGRLTVTGRWQHLSSGLPSAEDFRITAIGVSPDFPFDKTLFLAFDGSGVFKSSNADADAPSFSPINQGLGNLGVLSLALSPNYGRDASLFIGTRAGFVFRSTNGGESWTRLPLPPGVRGDVVAVALSPNFASDGTLFAGVEGSGVFASPDRGAGWAEMNDGLQDRAVQALAVSANYTQDGSVFAAGRFGGANRFGAGLPPRRATNLSPKFCVGSTSGGQPAAAPTPTAAPGAPTPASTPTAVPGAPTPAPVPPTATAVPEEQACLSITVTAENTATAENAPDGQALAISKPSAVKYTYVVKYEEGTAKELQSLTMNDDRGQIDLRSCLASPPQTAAPTLTPAPGGPTPTPTPPVDTLKLGHSKTCFRRVYVAQDQTWVVTARGIARIAGEDRELTASDDALVDAPAWASANTGLDDLWVRAFAISPYFANDRTVFAGGAYGGLFKYDGTAWKKVNDQLPERWEWSHGLALSPRFAQEPTVYLGTRSGVARSTDGGATWVPMGSGLANRAAFADPQRGVRALAVSPDFGNDRTVFAGVWRDNIYRARD